MTTENQAFANAKLNAEKGIPNGPQGNRSAVEFKAAAAGDAAAKRS